MTLPNTDPDVFFWPQHERVGECLVWTGMRHYRGYGLVKVRGQRWKTHRLAYTLAYGPIPHGYNVCHHCDNRPCDEPEHLFLGTQRDNMRDAAAKQRLDHRGERNGHAKLTEADVRTIRDRAHTTSRAALAREYGVAAANISGIVLGKYWRHI